MVEFLEKKIKFLVKNSWYFPSIFDQINYLPICANLGSLAMVRCSESTLCAGAGFHWQQTTFFRANLVTILKVLNWAFRKDFNLLCIWVALETISTHFELRLETWKYSLAGNPSDGKPLWCSRCFRFIEPDCTRALQHQRNCFAGGRHISRKTHLRSAILL